MGGGSINIEFVLQEDIEDAPPSPDPPGYDDTPDILVGNSPLTFIGHDTLGSHTCSVFRTPNGSRFYSPDVNPEIKPTVGQIFSSWSQAYNMYQNYGEKLGFGIKVSGYKKWKGEITHRVLVCNRFGKPKTKKTDSLDPESLLSKRSSRIKRCDCKALVRLKAIKGTTKYILYEFSENHNHSLISSDNMDLSLKGKHLNFDDIKFIHTMNLHKSGPSVSHRVLSSLKGGHHNMNGNKNVFKNVSRDIRLYVGDRDIPLVMKMLEDRSSNLPNFSYEFLHDGTELQGLFWADDVSKTSYQFFGDVIAFDATYSTNRYNIVFVPFTGVDHHKKCVTFGAGLIANETAEMYQWQLSSFLKVHQTQPTLVLTDQDPAMRIAVSAVFNRSAHRLCMWHIMKKLPSKISADLIQNTNVRSAIHKLVWSIYIRPDTFQERWLKMLNDYNLNDNVWLADMYSIRTLWVPAYFRELPMCCLMKTTSRCESSNAMFKLNSTHGNTLVQFLMSFDTALDHQRYNQRVLEFTTSTSCLQLKTGLEIEAHAAKVYTQSVFKDVQKEISKGLLLCFISDTFVEDQTKVYVISHMDHRVDFVNEFKVRFHMHEKSYDCSCMGFTRIGYLCRHVFCVMRLQKINSIPDRYISRRWRREILPTRVFSIDTRLGVDNSEKAVLRNNVIEAVSVCVDRLSGNVSDLSIFADKIKVLKEEILEASPEPTSSKKRQAAIAELVGHSEGSTSTLTPPQGIRNKGCGTNRRLVGPGEKAVENSKKAPRLCRTCKKWGNHDSRNCPTKEGTAAAEPSQ